MGSAEQLELGDGPWLHPGLELHEIKLLGLAAKDEAKILGGNAAALLPRRTRLIAV